MSENEMEQEIKWLRSRVVAINHKLQDILSNQRHYLRARAPEVMKNQRERIRQAEKLFEKLKAIPKLKVRTSYGGTSKRAYRVVFMCTPNEARKLRAMVDLDLRMLNGVRSSLARQRKK